MTIPGPALFDFRQIRYTFARKPGVILRCARVMLGASRRDVLLAMKAGGAPISMPRYKAIEGDLEGRNITAVEWWLLCRCLGLCAESFSIGYSARWHIMRIRGDIEQGEFRLPVSSILRVRLDALGAWDESRREQWMIRPGLPFRLRTESASSLLDNQK